MFKDDPQPLILCKAKKYPKRGTSWALLAGGSGQYPGRYRGRSTRQSRDLA